MRGDVEMWSHRSVVLLSPPEHDMSREVQTRRDNKIYSIDQLLGLGHSDQDHLHHTRDNIKSKSDNLLIEGSRTSELNL